MNDRSTPVLLVSALAATLLACGASGSDAAGSSSATSSAAARTTTTAPASSGSAQAAAPAKPAGAKTTGEVELHSSKKKLAYSIELPEGLKDVSESAVVKQYRKDKEKFDSFGFSILEGNEKFIKAGLDTTLAELSKNPAFVKNKVKILDKGTTATGWYWTHSLEEGGKKAVTATLMITKGDVSLQCKGEVEGALADKPEESSKAMLEACKTLTITGP